jgi:ribosome biogenesis GTPase
MKHDRFDFEEEFHARDRKQFRKERKHLQDTDRSKYKKSDQDQKGKPKSVDSALPRGRVISITGEGIWVEVEGQRFLCSLKGLLKKEKLQVKNVAAVGDYVRFEQTSPNEGSILAIDPRFSFLARTDATGTKEQLIAVNIDQVFLILSVVEPNLRPPLVDRYLIAAAKGSIHPIIVINKIDLLAHHPDEESLYQEFLAAYEPLGFPIVSVSTKTGAGVEAVRSLMKGKTSAVAGQSGVGKSSLLNAAFQMQLKIGDLAAKTAKGSHTTTAAELLPLPEGGYCVDTPGIRSFGVWNLTLDEVITHFRDIALLGQRCRFADCSHGAEPHCAVLAALKQGTLPLMRYESYTALRNEALGHADNRTQRLMDQRDG